MTNNDKKILFQKLKFLKSFIEVLNPHHILIDNKIIHKFESQVYKKIDQFSNFSLPGSNPSFQQYKQYR